MSSLPPLTSRQLSELRDNAQKNLVSQLCDALMDSTSQGTVKDKIKEPLADMMIQIMQNPENMSRLSDSVHSAIHKSLENSLKGPLLLYTLVSSESGFEEVKKQITTLFTQAYGEKATIRAFRGKLYALLQHSQRLHAQKGGNKKTHHKRQKGTARTRKNRYVRGGTSKAVPALLQEKIQEGVMDMATQQLSNAEKQDEPDSAELPDVAQQSEGSVSIASSEHDLREYNNALLDEMKKSIQEVREQMTSKMIDALFVSVKSNADMIVHHIVTSVSKTIEKDEMIKNVGPVIILQAMRASSTDIDKALISTFDEIRAKDPESTFDPIQSSFITTYMQHLKLRLTKQVTGK